MQQVLYAKNLRFFCIYCPWKFCYATCFLCSHWPTSSLAFALALLTQLVILGDSRISWVPVKFNVPQGSDLSSLFYYHVYSWYFLSLYWTLDLRSSSCWWHPGLRTSGPSSLQLALSQSLESLSADQNSRVSSNHLWVNPSKTRLICLVLASNYYNLTTLYLIHSGYFYIK